MHIGGGFSIISEALPLGLVFDSRLELETNKTIEDIQVLENPQLKKSKRKKKQLSPAEILFKIPVLTLIESNDDMELNEGKPVASRSKTTKQKKKETTEK